MINFIYAKKYCNEDISLIENYDKAIIDSNQTWHCHHRRELETSRKELIKIGEYYYRPAEELIFLPKSEHSILHFKGNKYWLGRRHSEEAKIKLSLANKGKKLSEETRKKLSEVQKGKKMSEEAKRKIAEGNKGKKYMLGKHHSEEAKRKISEGNKGKKRSEEAKRKIAEYRKGCHWFNNGIITVQAKSCPEGFVRGRIKRVKQS